jgi:3-oxoacyl-(acyl-carrier-protein) synthase
VAAALSLAKGHIPPTLGLTEPEMPLNHVLAPVEHGEIDRVVVNAMASGASFAALVFKAAAAGGGA